MLKSSPAGDVATLAITAEDINEILGTVLARALQENPDEEEEVEFVESVGDLPPIGQIFSEHLEELLQSDGDAAPEKQKKRDITLDPRLLDDDNAIDTIIGDYLP